MKSLGRFDFAVAALLLLSATAEARPRGGSSAPAVLPTCPQGIDNGCAAANQSAQIIFPNFFTTVRQSGQAQYKAAGGAASNHPPTFNVPGVDYPVGEITPDPDLKDPLLYLGSTDFTGCGYIPSTHTISCGNGAHNFSGYRWNGIGLYIPNTTGDFTFVDNHLTMTGDNCKNYQGTASVINLKGNNTLTNNRWDFTNECVFNAALYKSAFDPGLTTQATFPAAIAAGSMTVSGSSVGKIRVGQYVDFSGRSAQTPISAMTAPVAVTISSITISGSIATVTTSTAHGLAPGMGIRMDSQTSTGYRGDAEILTTPTTTSFTYAIPYYNTLPTVSATVVGTYAFRYCSGAACNGSVWTVAGTTTAASGTFTTGPIVPAFNGPASLGGNDITAHYNAILGAGQFIGQSATGKIDIGFNYEEIVQYPLQHVNFMFNNPPGAPVTQDVIFEGNNIWWNPNSELGVGTGTLDLFTSSGAASDFGPLTIDNFKTINNVIIANKSTVTGSYNTAALVRYLGQKGSGPDIKYTMTGGVLTVTQISGGTTDTKINPTNVVQCTLTGCFHTIKFIAQLTGSGGAPCPDVTCDGGLGTYSVDNTTDTVNNTSATARVSNFNGTINTLTNTGNYWDPTGTSSVYNFDLGNTNTLSTISSGNVNMVNGNACNYGGSC